MKATVSGYPIRTWDDGFGKLWVYRETLGPVGVVRASTWEDAWSCVVDEIMDDADPDDPDTWEDGEIGGDLAEGHHWRGSGVPSNHGPRIGKSVIAREDLNGARLERLTRELCDLLRLHVDLREGGAS